MTATRLFRFLLALSLFSIVALRAQDTGELVTPARKLSIDQPSAEWKPLFDSLGQRATVSALFTENRYLPFKKIPVVFEGEIRFARGKGLSLHYTNPEERILVVDTQGVLARDAKGRPHEFSDAHARATVGPMLNIMSFDLPELSKSFDLYGIRNGTTWKLAFDPNKSELAKSLSRLVISGHDNEVTKIEMHKGVAFGVEILIRDPKYDVRFTPAELTKFFR